MWLPRGRAKLICVDPPSLPLVTLRDKCTVPIGVVDLLERRISAPVTLAPMALSSVVSSDPPRPLVS